jgi:hypothetical protein
MIMEILNPDDLSIVAQRDVFKAKAISLAQELDDEKDKRKERGRRISELEHENAKLRKDNERLREVVDRPVPKEGELWKGDDNLTFAAVARAGGIQMMPTGRLGRVFDQYDWLRWNRKAVRVYPPADEQDQVDYHGYRAADDDQVRFA